MTPRFHRWPELLRHVAQDLGEGEALRLAGLLGGTKQHIPTRCSAQIAAITGEALAGFLVEHYGGLYLPIPNFAARLADERRRFVLQNTDLSANDIARRLGITSRRVEQIRAEARVDPNQLHLFD